MYIEDELDSKVSRIEEDSRSKFNKSSVLKNNARFPTLVSRTLNGNGDLGNQTSEITATTTTAERPSPTNANQALR